jgi:hypothetical protein
VTVLLFALANADVQPRGGVARSSFGRRSK